MTDFFWIAVCKNWSFPHRYYSKVSTQIFYNIIIFNLKKCFTKIAIMNKKCLKENESAKRKWWRAGAVQAGRPEHVNPWTHWPFQNVFIDSDTISEPGRSSAITTVMTKPIIRWKLPRVTCAVLLCILPVMDYALGPSIEGHAAEIDTSKTECSCVHALRHLL